MLRGFPRDYPNLAIEEKQKLPEQRETPWGLPGLGTLRHPGWPACTLRGGDPTSLQQRKSIRGHQGSTSLVSPRLLQQAPRDPTGQGWGLWCPARAGRKGELPIPLIKLWPRGPKMISSSDSSLHSSRTLSKTTSSWYWFVPKHVCHFKISTFHGKSWGGCGCRVVGIPSVPHACSLGCCNVASTGTGSSDPLRSPARSGSSRSAARSSAAGPEGRNQAQLGSRWARRRYTPRCSSVTLPLETEPWITPTYLHTSARRVCPWAVQPKKLRPLCFWHERKSCCCGNLQKIYRKLLTLREWFCFGKQMAFKYFWNSSFSGLLPNTFTQSWNFLLNTQHGFFVVKPFRRQIQFNKFYISWLKLLVLLMNHWEVHKCQEHLLGLLLLPYMANIHLFISQHLKLSLGVFPTLLLFLKISLDLQLGHTRQYCSGSPDVTPGWGGCAFFCFFFLVRGQNVLHRQILEVGQST